MDSKTLMIVGAILLVVGIIGLVMSYSTIWMGVLIVLGVIGVVWGWMKKSKSM